MKESQLAGEGVRGEQVSLMPGNASGVLRRGCTHVSLVVARAVLLRLLFVLTMTRDNVPFKDGVGFDRYADIYCQSGQSAFGVAIRRPAGSSLSDG